jgi:hypothetical protein
MFKRTFILTLAMTTLGASLLFAQVALKEIKVEKAFVKEVIVHGNFPDAFKVTAIDTAGNPLPAVTIKGFVQSGDAQLYTNQVPAQTATAATDTAGVAKFSLATRNQTDAVILFIPQVGGNDVSAATKTFNLSASSGLATSLGSKRSYLQLFVGQTFKNAYEKVAIDTDSNPETEEFESRNVGFANAGPIIRLTFNTMWAKQKLSRRARTGGQAKTTTTVETTRITTVTPADGSTPQVTTTKGLTTFGTPPDDNRQHSWRHGLFHTDANLEFSRFPFGDDITEENKAGVDDAFSGTLGLTWEPNRLSSYDERTADDRKSDKHQFDAYRFAVFSKTGLTTRLTREADGNNSIYRIQAGIRFTHSRSDQPNQVSEDRNHEPIRFVEASYGRFSEWGKDHGANRLVIDAGLRINALSNEVFPVYVGGHFNTGPGEDDLRIFLGVLMKLDLLGRLVQSVAPSPE